MRNGRIKYMPAMIKTDAATITLLADGEQLAQLSHISLGKTKDKFPVDTMFAIMIASLIMAGAGYIVIKKDKK